MTKNIFLVVVSVIIMLFGSVGNVFGAEKPIKVLVDGVEVKFDQPPIIENDRVLVPIRQVAEAMGFSVNYFPEFPTTVTVSDLKRRGTTATIYWGENTTGYVDTNFKDIKKEVRVKFDPLPKVYSGRTLMGLRNIADILGANSQWSGETRTVNISVNIVLNNNSPEVNEIVHDIDWVDLQASKFFNSGRHSELMELYKEYQDEFELEVIKLVNIERTNNNLNAVEKYPALMKVARTKAEEMATLNYYSHNSPNGGSHTEYVKYHGIDCTYAGENIDVNKDTPSSVVKSWMNSEGHRKHIMNPKLKQIGVGFASGFDNEAEYVATYWSLFMMY